MKSIYSDYGVSIKLRLYSMQKHQILIVFLCFFSAFFLTTTIGIFGPKMLTTIASNLTRAEISKPSAIIFESPNLGKFHQQLWLTGQPIIQGRKEEFVKKFTLSIRHLTTKDQHLEFLNRSRNIHCKNEICDAFNILHLDYLHNEKYRLELKFLSIDDLKNFNIENFLFKFNSYNPSFTKLELWYRFAFLFITLIVLILYTNSLKKFSLRDWSIEQKWIFILLRSLIFFNNPLLPLIVLVDSWIPHLLDAIFQSTFLALLMVFWLSIFHGFRHNDRNFTTFYIPKFVIVFSIWLISLFLLLWQQFRSLNDPSYNLSMDENYYFVFRILLFFFLVVYFLFLLYLMVRAAAELKKMPYFGIRIKFASIMMLIVIFSLLIIALMRLKSDSFKQSLFENFTKNYRNTTEFCALFSIINIYMYTLAYVYSPAKNASIDSDYADNPTFAMLNDTDEEDVVMEPLNKTPAF